MKRIAACNSGIETPKDALHFMLEFASKVLFISFIWFNIPIGCARSWTEGFRVKSSAPFSWKIDPIKFSVVLLMCSWIMPWIFPNQEKQNDLLDSSNLVWSKTHLQSYVDFTSSSNQSNFMSICLLYLVPHKTNNMALIKNFNWLLCVQVKMKKLILKI